MGIYRDSKTGVLVWVLQGVPNKVASDYMSHIVYSLEIQWGPDYFLIAFITFIQEKECIFIDFVPPSILLT